MVNISNITIMLFIIIVLFIVIFIIYFVNNDNDYIIIKPVKNKSKLFSIERFVKGLLVDMKVINSDYFNNLFFKGDVVNEKETESVIDERDRLIKPTKNQKQFFSKYNKEQKKITEADTEFIDKFMQDYKKFKNKELTMQDMIDKYKVDSTTIYRRGKRWSK